MSFLGLLHRRCNRGDHAYWPPWHTTKRCLLCGCFSSLKAGDNTITLENELIKWSATGTPAAVNQLGFNTTQNKPSVYYDGGVKTLKLGKGWEHVETKTISTSTATSTFSGLSGSTTPYYLIQGHFKNDNTFGATAYYMRPNNSGTSCRAGYLKWTDTAAPSSGANATTWRIGLGSYRYGTYSFSCLIMSNRSIGGTTLRRTMLSNFFGCYTDTAGRVEGEVVSNIWNNTATNLTSLVITCASGGIGAGSEFSLYRMDDGA